MCGGAEHDADTRDGLAGWWLRTDASVPQYTSVIKRMGATAGATLQTGKGATAETTLQFGVKKAGQRVAGLSKVAWEKKIAFTLRHLCAGPLEIKIIVLHHKSEMVGVFLVCKKGSLRLILSKVPRSAAHASSDVKTLPIT